MHAKSILAILTTVAVCSLSVMAGPVAIDASSDLVKRGFDDTGALLELVEREFISSPVDVEARSFDDELSARDLEEVDAREETVELEARARGPKKFKKRVDYTPSRGLHNRRQTRVELLRQVRRRRAIAQKRNRRNRRRAGAPSPSPGPSGGYPPGPPTPPPPPGPPTPPPPGPAPIMARSIRRNRATTPLNEKQQARVASLDNACNAIGNKKSNKKCKGLVDRLRRNMSRKNALVAEITKMTAPAPAAQ